MFGEYFPTSRFVIVIQNFYVFIPGLANLTAFEQSFTVIPFKDHQCNMFLFIVIVIYCYFRNNTRINKKSTWIAKFHQGSSIYATYFPCLPDLDESYDAIPEVSHHLHYTTVSTSDKSQL